MSFRPSTGGQSEILVMDMDGTEVRQLTDTGTNGSPRARHRLARGRDFDGEKENAEDKD